MLCEIFGWCVGPCQPISVDEAPLLFLNVCRRWREVGLAHSRLWTDFSITISQYKPIPSLSILRLWSRCINSNDVNVCIRVEGDGPYEYHALRRARPLLQYLDDKIPCSSWNKAVLILPGSEGFLQGLLKNTYPIQLTSLRLELRGWDTAGIKHLATLLRGMPRLRDLEWSDEDHWGISETSSASFLLQSNIEWRSLTSLVLNTYTSLNMTYHILSQCKDLRTLRLSRLALGDITRDLMPESKYISLPHLQSLTIRQHCLDGALAKLFDLLICPDLAQIDVGTKNIETHWPNDSFVSLLKRSSCNLRTLRLEYMSISEPELTMCLRHNSSSLESLEVREMRGCICVSDKVLSMLTVQKDTGGDVLCPRLTSIRLARCIGCSNGFLASMLRSRDESAPFRVVDVHFPYNGPLNSEDVLYLRERGLDGAMY